MKDTAQYLIVDSASLPDVFLRVVEAKALLNSGRAHSASAAASMAGISRSAFYKYRDAVFPYHSRTGGRMISLRMVLQDRAGVLSGVMAVLCQAGANILTLNQNIPVSGLAPVSVSARTDDMNVDTAELIARLTALDGVVSIETFSGE